MRGSDEATGSLFSYVDLEERVPARHPLHKLQAVVNDALRSPDAELLSVMPMCRKSETRCGSARNYMDFRLLDFVTLRTVPLQQTPESPFRQPVTPHGKRGMVLLQPARPSCATGLFLYCQGSGGS